MRSHTLAPDSCASPATRTVIVGEDGSQFAARSRRHILYRVGVAILALLFCHGDWFEEVRRVRSIVDCVSLAFRMPAVLKAIKILPCPANWGAGSPQFKAFSASPSCP